MVNPPTYIGGSPYTRLNDGSATLAWFSNYQFYNTLDFVFDTNLNATTGFSGDDADLLTLTSLALTGDGSISQLRQFGIYVQMKGSGTWFPLLQSKGAVTDYNYAMTAQGGKLVNPPTAQYAAPASYLNDGTSVTKWLSNYSFANNLDFVFDSNLDGVTGTASDQFTLTKVALTGDASSNMLRQFGVQVQQNGSSTWQRLIVASGPVTDYNYAMAAQGGKLVNAPAGQYSYPAGYVADGTVGTQWASNYLYGNNLDFVFDPNLDGLTGTASDQFTLTKLAITGDGTVNMLRQFQLWVDSGSGLTLMGTYTLAQSTARQIISVGPVSNVVAVRIATVSTFGGSYVSINELEVLGDGIVASPLFTTVKSTARQVFIPDTTLNAGKLDNISGVRVYTVNGWGGSFLTLNELEILGNGTVSNPLFSLSQNTSRQVVALDPVLNAGKLSGITGVRLYTIDGFGGTYISLNEVEILGNGSVSSPLFTLAKNTSRQVFTPDPVINAGLLSNITSVRVKTVNNYGDAYVGLNELEILGSPGSVTSVSSFNCVEVGASATTGHLYTKVAGIPTSIDLVALTSGGAIANSYSGSVTVALVDASGGGACASLPVIFSVGGFNFTASDQGRRTYGPFTLGTAYSKAMCRITDTSQTPNVVSCSSDSFAVRPHHLFVGSSAASDSSGSDPRASPVASPALKAGTAFTVYSQAQDASANTTQNYGGTPQLDLTKLQAHSGANQVGVLTGSLSNVVPSFGLAYSNTFTYSEVGYVRMGVNGVYDTSFTAVDAASGDCTPDFSNMAVGGKYGCWFGNDSASTYFGRFTPDHFALSPGSMNAACATHPGAVAGYTPSDFT